MRASAVTPLVTRPRCQRHAPLDSAIWLIFAAMIAPRHTPMPALFTRAMPLSGAPRRDAADVAASHAAAAMCRCR